MVQGTYATFCHHCGAPQLFLMEHDRPQSPEGEGTGAAPPPRVRAIDWKVAMASAAAVASLAAVLSLVSAGLPSFTVLNWLWILGASTTTLMLYQRRRPKAGMNAQIGARIGVLTGLTVVGFVAIAMTFAGLIGRFATHSMGGFDSRLSEQLHLQMDHAVSTNPVPREMLPFFYSPEFAAGMMLAGIAMIAALVVVLCILIGAAGGMLRTRQRRAA